MPHRGFTIVVEGEVFHVNPQKYARESDFMRALIEGSYLESTQRSVTLIDVSLDDWTVFYDYIEGVEKLGPHNAETVYYIADRFGFEKAKGEVESLLEKENTLKQFIEWEYFAIQMLHLINRLKDRKRRALREKVIALLERNHVNVGKSMQHGRLMYQSE